MQPQHPHAQLERQLRAFLGPLDDAALGILREHLTWVELPAGQTLMTQGEPGDAMYLTISGRLRAYLRDEEGVERRAREMARGQVIGEMSLYTDEPRSATVVAIRDSVLVRLAKADFQRLLQSSATASIALTRQVIQRLQAPPGSVELARPVTMALMPVSAGVALVDFAPALAEQLQRLLPAGRICLVDADCVDEALDQPGLARTAFEDQTASRRIAQYLDQVEAEHDYVLLMADDSPTAWTQRCTRRCDELLLLADADEPPELHASERAFLVNRGGRAEAAEILILLHPSDRRCPQGTAAWLARRRVSDHVHIRPALARDMARLARLQSRNAVGLVLAGGGARGLAHLGIFQALQARGVVIDCVGGTSIGAAMACLVASDQPADELLTIARQAFGSNPTGDFNWLPLISLIKGRRMRQAVRAAAQRLFGGEPAIEDLWKNFFCVASNYSQAREHVARSGPLLKALYASMAIPGALPPELHEGDLLCDGGTFNNYPADLMRNRRGIGKVIGVDLALRKARRIELEEMPGPWALLRDRLRPRRLRRFRLPSLTAFLMNVTILYSSSRQQQARKLTDLYFNPPLERVGMLQWDRFDQIVQQGQAHANEVLAAMSAQALQPYQTAGTR